MFDVLIVVTLEVRVGIPRSPTVLHREAKPSRELCSCQKTEVVYMETCYNIIDVRCGWAQCRLLPKQCLERQQRHHRMLNRSIHRTSKTWQNMKQRSRRIDPLINVKHSRYWKDRKCEDIITLVVHFNPPGLLPSKTAWSAFRGLRQWTWTMIMKSFDALDVCQTNLAKFLSYSYLFLLALRWDGLLSPFYCLTNNSFGCGWYSQVDWMMMQSWNLWWNFCWRDILKMTTFT